MIMSHLPSVAADLNLPNLNRKLRHYSAIGLRLFVQRQLIYCAAFGLTFFYYDAWIAVTTLILMLISELFDYRLFRNIRRQTNYTIAETRSFLYQIYFGTLLNGGAICFFAIALAIGQGPTTHFMPLFFLFAAALFAAMNNHQIMSVLVMRLVMYGAAFIFIPARDIWLTNAPLSSELWMQFFTSLFVLFFIVECSRIYLNFYRRNMASIDALRVEHEKTKNAYRAKTQFLSTVSHELRTPLTSIKGSLELIGSGALGEVPERMRRLFAISQSNTARLHSLIDEILDFQKIEAGMMKYDFRPVSVATLIENAIEMNRPYAERNRVSIQNCSAIEDVKIDVDAKRIEQVFANVLSNAAKFSTTGGQVRVAAQSDGDTIFIDIADEGVGLSEADKEKVFDQFSQIDSSDTRSFGGTGLGMNISKRIMEAHHGTIDYSKNAGPGTTFHIALPLRHRSMDLRAV